MFAFKCVILEINGKVLANLNRKILIFRVYKKCLDGSDYQKNVILILFVQSFMKCICNKLKNLD